MLTTEAFNALLKTLEEPPSYVIFILATTEFHKIPATIISRCQKFDFRRITFKDTARRISEVAAMDGINVSQSAVNLLSKAADGSLRDGLSKLDQCMALGLSSIDYKDVAEIIGASDPEFLSELCDYVIDSDLSKALKKLDDGINIGIDPVRLYVDMADYFRDLMMYKATGDSSLLMNAEQEVIAKYAAQSKKITLAKILRISEALTDGMNTAKYALSPKLAFEITLLKIAAKETDPDINGILERLEKIESKLNNLSFVPAVSDTHSEKTDIINNKESEVIPEEISGQMSDEVYDEIPEASYYDDYNEAMNTFEEYEDAVGIVSPQNEQSEDIGRIINENFKDILKLAKNTDMGFESIIKKSKIKYENGVVVLSFSEAISYDIASKFNYNIIMKQALCDYFGKEINVVIENGKSTPAAIRKNEVADNYDEDPLDSLLKLADDNMSLFNIEN